MAAQGKWRKKGIWLLALAMTIGLLAACTSGNRESGQSPATNSPAASAPAASGSGTNASEEPAEPMEIRWLSFNTPEEDGNMVQKYIEEKFNVKIVNMRIDRQNYEEQLNVQLASGIVPDMWLVESSRYLYQYAAQDLLAEVDIDTVRKHMPTHAKNVDGISPALWNNVMYKGKMLGVPRYWMEGGSFYLPAYNKAWLTAIGYDRAPETLDEFVDVLRKFRNNDPDGNGIKDTYGMTATGKNFQLGSFSVLFAAHQAVPMRWLINGEGKPQYAFTTENARQAFRLINQLYSEGVIDPEFITDDDATVVSKFVNGRDGATDWGFWYNYHPDFGGSVGAQMKELGKELVVGKGLKNDYGEPRALGWGPGAGLIAFGKPLENDPAKMQKIMEILDFLISDDEAYLFSSYGNAGEHYELDNGVVVRKEGWEDAVQLAAKTGAGLYYNPLTGSANMFKYDRTPEQIEFRTQANEGTVQLYNAVNFPIVSAADYPDLSKLENEYWLKFITGEANLDQDWDDWVELWYNSGGRAMTDEAVATYESMKKQP